MLWLDNKKNKFELVVFCFVVVCCYQCIGIYSIIDIYHNRKNIIISNYCSVWCDADRNRTFDIYLEIYIHTYIYTYICSFF